MTANPSGKAETVTCFHISCLSCWQDMIICINKVGFEGSFFYKKSRSVETGDSGANSVICLGIGDANCEIYNG